MKTRKIAKLFVFSAVLLFLLPAKVCLANPITPGYYADKMIFTVGVDLAVDAVVLIICYSLLRQVDNIASWDFVKYIMVVMAGGLAIDLSCAFAMNDGVILYAFIAFILLSFYNFTLCRATFVIDRWKAIVVGIVMGIFTNPVISLFIAEARY